MKWNIAFFLGILAIGAFGNADAGISLAFKSAFFNNIKDAIIPYFTKALVGKSSTIGPMEFNAYLFEVKFEIYESKFSRLDIDNSLTKVTLNEEKNTLAFNIDQLNLEYEIKLGWNTSNHLWFGNGSANVNIKNFSFGLAFSPMWAEEIDKFAIKLVSVDTAIQDESVGITIEGDNDLFTVLNMAQNALRPFLVSKLKDVTPSDLVDLEAAINGILESMSMEAEIVPNVFLNYGPADHPKVEKDFMHLAVNGTVTAKGHPNKLTPTPIPTYTADGGALQLYISEYTLDTGLTSMFQAGALVFDIDAGINTDIIAVFLPTVKDMYPDPVPVKMQISANPAPYMDIKKDNMKIKAGAVLSVMAKVLPEDTQLLTLDLDLDLFMNVKAENGKVVGSLFNFDFNVENCGSSQPIDCTSLDMLVGTLLKVAIPQVNNILSDGFELPTVLGISFANAFVAVEDKYLRVDITPEVSPELVHFIMPDLPQNKKLDQVKLEKIEEFYTKAYQR